MPIVTTPSGATSSRMRAGMNLGAGKLQQAVGFATVQDRSAPVVMGGIALGGALDLVDTVASSIPGLSDALGVERGAVNRYALQALDMPGLGDFYHDYKGGIEAASGIGGAILSEVVARRLTAPGTAVMGLLGKLPYARRIAALDNQYTNAMQVVRQADVNLAARGALGAEQYVGRTIVDNNIFDSLTGTFVSAGTKEVARDSAVRAAKWLGFGKGVKNAAATEAVMALTLNQNGFLYDDSAAHNLAWMAGGLGIGGVAERFSAAYQMRKFVNSDQIRRTFAGALDPGMQEEARLLWHGKNVKADEEVSFLGGIFSDRSTNLLVNARTLTEGKVGEGVAGQQLAASQSALATQHVKLAREEMQKLTRRGISSDGYTRFNMDSLYYGKHLDMLVHRDPAALYGAEQIGGVADDKSVGLVHEQHIKRLQERIDETEERIGSMLDDEGQLLDTADPKEMAELQRFARRLDYESTLTPVAIIDGEQMPISEAEAFDGWKEPKIAFRPEERVKGTVEGTVKDKHGLYEALTEEGKTAVSLGTDFIYHIPGKGKNVNNADHYDIMRMYRLGNDAIKRMAQFKGPMILPKKPDWFQLDMAEELLRRTNGRANVVFPEGMTRETARIEALVQKAQGIKKWDAEEARKIVKAEKAGATYEGALSKLRLRYNLPRLTAYERGILGEFDHPVEQLLRGVADMSPDEIKKMSLTEIQNLMGKNKRVGDMAPVQSSDIEEFGGSFRFMMDEGGEVVKPLIMYKRPFQVASWTQEHNAERLAAMKMYSLNRLTAPDAAPITKSITGSVINSPDFDLAARTHELMDTQIQGGLSGSAPQSQTGAFGKAFVSSEWRDRDNPTLLAATRLRENVSRMARDHMKATIDSAFEGNLGLLANPRNATSKLLLNQFHSYRPGWDIATKPLARDDGYFAFMLRPTKDNADRFRKLFGKEMAEKGQVLLAPNGKEVVLDQMALDLQQRFNVVTNAIRQEKNTILKANGRGEISELDWYVPPQQTDGKLIGFTIGPDGKPVPGMSVVANSEAEFASARDDIMKQINSLGLGYQFRTQDEIREFANIWDKVQMDFINPGITAVQPGRQSAGALAGPNLRMNAFEDSLKRLQSDFMRHSNDIVETLLREQVNSAKARANVSSELTKNMANSRYTGATRNTYSYYLENLLGKSKINSEASWVGGFYSAIEGPLDKFLSEATPHAAKVWHATTQWLGKSNPMKDSEQSRKDFDALTTKLGKYMPFENAVKFAEAQGLGATPPTVASIVGSVNKFSAAVILRMFEVAHPIMNLTGILNASPAVIRNFTPQAGETSADFARRVGHAANIFELPDGRAVGTLDMTKIASRAFKRAWQRESHEDYDYMVRRGFLSQEVAEFHQQFGTIDSKGRWETFFYGDPNKKGLKQKGVVGWTGLLSDKSEDFSRSWGHMVGLEVADVLGISQKEARHTFAHDIANKMIANYSPHNRPEIFQGGLGASIGLFQSFILNYYQRMFRYVETKDYKALATQLSTQAGLFGVTSIPGWGALNKAFFDDEKSQEEPEGLWRRLGGNAGDLLGHGLISTIPQLFGAPAVDLYSRGDVSIRQLQIQGGESFLGGVGNQVSASIPALNVARKFYDGLRQGIGLFSDNNPNLTTTQLGEIVSNSLANRPLAGMLEQFVASGNDSDPRGQLISRTGEGGIVENVLAGDFAGIMESTYRLIGLRSMRQSRELEAFYGNKNAMAHKAANDQQLNFYTRQMIRSGDTEHLPEVFEQYLKNGGDPRNFRRWIKASYVAATSTRAERQLDKVLNDPNKIDQVLRLLDAGVSVADDQAVEGGDALYVANAQEQPLTQGGDFAE